MPPFLGREIYFSRLFLPTYYLVDLQGLGNCVGMDSNQRVLLLICMELWGPCFGVKVRKVGLGAGPGVGGVLSPRGHTPCPQVSAGGYLKPGVHRTEGSCFSSWGLRLWQAGGHGPPPGRRTHSLLE